MRSFLAMLLLFSPLMAWADGPVQGRIVKMLPLLLDQKGQDALSPSLFDRDAYQAQLRTETNDISGVRYDVQWQVSNPGTARFKLRLELRGAVVNGQPLQKTLETEVKSSPYRHWDSLMLTGEAYKNFGLAVAWRATLWADDQLVAEQKSFLW